jgi:hypothetical protein
MEKALKPGCRAFLYLAPEYGKARLDHAIEAAIQSSNWSHYFKYFTNPFSLKTPAQLATFAEAAHLQVKRMEIDPIDEIFSDRESFAAWMIGWMVHLKQLPKEHQKPFLEEVIDRYLIDHPLDSEGNIHFIDYMIEIELIKE